MSKRKHHKDCCCEHMDYGYGDECCNGNIFGGINNCVAPIIFLLIACGSGILNNNCSYLIILLFLLCGGSGIFGGGDHYGSDCCC